MRPAEILLGTLITVAALGAAARRLGVPYPIPMILGGLALGFVPGLPRVELPPDLVFLLFLPPLIYAGSVSSSLKDLRRFRAPITSLAIGLVLATSISVAALAHLLIPSMSWPVAFVLGTVVSATDIVSVMSITERLAASRSVTVILEGEGLLNDPASLVIYRMAVAAAVTGAFSFSHAGMQFVGSALGGALIGLGIGWLTLWARSKLDDPTIEMTVSLLTPFAAYLPAELIGASGVVAVAAAGLYVGRKGPEAIPAETRIQVSAVWDVIVFLLTAFLFILLGFQSRSILMDIGGRSLGRVLLEGGAVCLAVIVVRIVWVFLSAWILHFAAFRQRMRIKHLRETSAVAWAGLRGVDTLAAALALPLVAAGGEPFPFRSMIIFTAFLVIVVTLILQGLTLAPLIRRLGLCGDDELRREESRARIAAVKAALGQIESLAGRDGVSMTGLNRIREMYVHRLVHLEQEIGGAVDEQSPDHHSAHDRLRLQVVDAERKALIDLRDQGDISDDVLRRVQRDLDLEELRLQ